MPKFHVVFDDKIPTVPLMRESIIPPNWTYIVQLRSQIGAPENIELKDTWFNPDMRYDTGETPTHKPCIAPYNNNKKLTLPQSKPNVQENPAIKGTSV